MAETSGGSKKLLWIMIILVLLSSAGAAAAIYMVMDQRDGDTEATEEQQAMEREPPIFMRIDPFTVNLADDSYGSRLLYTGVTLRVGNDESRIILEEHMPQVRSRLLMLLSGKQADELTSTEGKQQLAQAIVDRLNVPLTDKKEKIGRAHV